MTGMAGRMGVREGGRDEADADEGVGDESEGEKHDVVIGGGGDVGNTVGCDAVDDCEVRNDWAGCEGEGGAWGSSLVIGGGDNKHTRFNC